MMNSVNVKQFSMCPSFTEKNLDAVKLPLVRDVERNCPNRIATQHTNISITIKFSKQSKIKKDRYQT